MNKINEIAGAIIGLGGLIVILALMWGNILNIYKFCKLDFEPNYKAEVIRLVSIPTGLGSIVGYFNFKEEKK